MKKDIRERLKDEVLLADGAMGTLLLSRGAPSDGPRSPVCLTHPELVAEIHEDYAQAGAQILSTNSWDANRAKLARFDWSDSLEKINRRAVSLAREAASGEYLYVAGKVGPLGQLVKPYGPLTTSQVREMFAEQIAILLEEGVDLLAIETFSSALELVEAIHAARALSADIPILASMTVLADGKTPFGAEPAEALNEIVAAGADVVGLNCTIGPQETLEALTRMAGRVPAPLSVMPNAGYPWIVGGRAVYPATPDYFREVAREFVRAGAAVVGGCCGSGPEHVAAMAREVSGQRRRQVEGHGVVVEVSDRRAGRGVDSLETSPLKRKLADPDAFLVTAEIEPPRGSDASAAVEAARELKAAGVDAVNVAETPMARLRMSSIAVAHLVRRETGLDAIFHYTPRDRNVLGIQSDLLGAAGLGVKAILVVGGDPLKIGDYPQAKPVGEVDTVGLLRIVKGLNAGVDMAGGLIGSSTTFAIGCQVNPNAANLDLEASRLSARIEAGASFVQTQAVYDLETFERFLALPEASAVPILAGVTPLKGYRQALYFANEVPGMAVPETVLARMRAAAARGPEFETEEGLAIAGEIATALAGRCRGVHLMPMGRLEVVPRLLLYLPTRQAVAAIVRPGGPGDGASGAAAVVRPGGPGDGASGAAAVVSAASSGTGGKR